MIEKEYIPFYIIILIGFIIYKIDKSKRMEKESNDNPVDIFLVIRAYAMIVLIIILIILCILD